MRNVMDCVTAFVPLLDTSYEIILGRKGKSVLLKLTFDKKDCFHLMGLQYLSDRPELSRDRGKVFDDIRSGKISSAKIESSDFYQKIKMRIHFLPLLEEMLDSNQTIFKYNKKLNSYSLIDAQYLLKNHLENKNLFLFLSPNNDETYFCKSFFPENNMDYTKNQSSWTLLYKKKTNLKTGCETILYDKITKRQ